MSQLEDGVLTCENGMVGSTVAVCVPLVWSTGVVVRVRPRHEPSPGLPVFGRRSSVCRWVDVCRRHSFDRPWSSSDIVAAAGTLSPSPTLSDRDIVVVFMAEPASNIVVALNCRWTSFVVLWLLVGRRCVTCVDGEPTVCDPLLLSFGNFSSSC
jgi:hypothetical protein